VPAQADQVARQALNTQVNVITDEQRVAALMTMIARAKSSGEILSGETRTAVAQSAYGHDEISWHDDKQPD
jgi:hypothetical protein